MGLDFKKVYQFKISLKGIQPAIWRQIQVPENYSFWDLHVAIQDVMGWLDYHLHLFRIAEPALNEIHEIGIPDEYELDFLPGWELAISDHFSLEKNSAEYEYDFGDSWQHEIILEKILSKEIDSKYPKCIAGERACPPEDCGGIGGYQEFLEAILDLNHEEHERMLEWVGGSFYPESFDPRQVSFDDPEKRWETAFGSDEE
ncbi:plasmid pRiA4b ORF-3 family protein [Acidobacteria bacterium AH-259-D05]|nr:plasmid pRiA4b ORF-3 family protein [Acidobacteria bacterium AH-259-D05]